MMEKLSSSVFLEIVRTLWSHRNVSSLPQRYKKVHINRSRKRQATTSRNSRKSPYHVTFFCQK